MPDLYPIPGFGPEEILEMARSALRQVKEYKLTISLEAGSDYRDVKKGNTTLLTWDDIREFADGKTKKDKYPLGYVATTTVLPASHYLAVRHPGIYSRKSEREDLCTEFSGCITQQSERLMLFSDKPRKDTDSLRKKVAQQAAAKNS